LFFLNTPPNTLRAPSVSPWKGETEGARRIEGLGEVINKKLFVRY